MSKSLERAFPWILLAPVALPVVIWSGLIYPYLVPKTLLFYALGFVALGTFAILVAQGRAFFWGRLARWEARIPAALLALAYVASAFGIDFYRSFWSLFVRGDGLLMLSCAVVSFYLILLSADRAFFERLLRGVAVVGSLVAVYGIGEWLMSGGRIGSLLGNAAFFAGYLGIAVFATLAATQGLPGQWRRAAAAGAALQVVAIILSATRGTMLALGVAGLAALAYFAWRGAGKRRAWAAGALISLGVVGGAFFALRGEIAKVPFEPIARIATISTTEADVASRLFIWKNMVTEIAQTPWLGVGAEHIDVLFNRFYDPTQISEQWFDRSHNAFLDYAAQYGLGGLLLYLALIASFLTAAAREARRGDRPRAGLFALLALTYAVQNFFVFDTVSSFWLMLALLAALLAVSFGEVPRTTLRVPPWSRAASWIFAGMLALALIPVSIRPVLAAYDLSEAYAYQVVDVSKEVAYLSRGIALGTYGDLEYGYEAYDMYANNQAAVLSGTARVDAYQAARNILTANFNRYPYDARTALYLAQVLSIAPPDAPEGQQFLSEALMRAINLSPKRSQSWYITANLLIGPARSLPAGAQKTALYEKAISVFEQYIALVPRLALPRYMLAELYLANGDRETADAQAAFGKQYYASDKETARRAAGYYENTKEWPDAAVFLKQAIELDPTDTGLRLDLAKVTYLSGDPAAATALVKELQAQDAAILSTDPAFEAAITAYERSVGSR